jgi:hypothetical protein
MKEYKNRYGDIYTFTLDSDKNIVWKGDFEFCRFGFPNVYKDAYDQYQKDGGEQNIEWFKEEVHKYEPDTWKPSEIAKKYGLLVYSDMNTINMVDPSGGPYMTSHMDLGDFLGKKFNGLCIREFKHIENGYLIFTYDKYEHLADNRSSIELENYPDNATI